MVDWTCAITPFFMLRDLQMPKRRKVTIQIILSLGMFGSAAGLVRMGFYHAYDTEQYPIESLRKTNLFPQSRGHVEQPLLIIFDPDNWGHTILWSVLEAGLGVIACSLPPLGIFFKKFYYNSTSGSGRKSGPATSDVSGHM